MIADPLDAPTIPDALRRAAAAFPDDEAVADPPARRSFAALWDDALAGAARLVAAGVEAGDRVALSAPNSLGWITASFSVYAAGATLVPLNTRFKGPEAADIVTRSGARMLLTVTDFAAGDLLDALDHAMGADRPPVALLSGDPRPGAPSWAERTPTAADRNEVARRLSAIDPDDTSDLIFTSGTTGAPKGAMLTHGASVRTYRAWSDAVGLGRGDRYLCVYPFFHTAGLKSGILACVLRGAAVLPHAVFDVDAVMAKVAEERVTVLPGPPSVFQSILAHPRLADFDLSSLRLSVTGAAVVPAPVVAAMREELRIPCVVTGYGLTETTGTVSMCHQDDPPEVIATTVGRPLPGVEVRVVGDGATPVPPGEAGEIEVRGFNVMKGYFGDPVATAAAVGPDGWLATGDVGVVDSDGNLRITDRKKDMFIVGGFNAYPAEIEKMLLEHPDIVQVAVVGIPDERLGEVGAAWVVERSPGSVRPDELTVWCRDRMANYKVPRRVEVVEALPLTPSGKVMKFALRGRLG